MKFRYFFDSGSGICLWAADSEAKEAYGYPVDLKVLHLSTELEREGDELIKCFDSNIDWNNLGGSAKWSNKESEEFYERSNAFFGRLQEELGEEYQVLNEVCA